MKLHEFTEQEFLRLAEIEFDQLKGEEPLSMLKELCLDEEADNLEEIAKKLRNNKDFNASERMSFILGQLLTLDDWDSSPEDLKVLEEKMAAESANRIYPLLWIEHFIELQDEEEFFESEMVDFLIRVLEKFEYLVELDDFFDETRIFSKVFHHERLEKFTYVLLPVIEQASERFPDKYILRRVLGKLHFFRFDYERSLKIFHSLREEIQEQCELLSDINSDDFDGYNFITLMNDIALVYDKLEDYEKVLEYTNYVVSVIPTFVYTDKDGKEITDTDDVSNYLETYLLRMRANMVQGKHEAFWADYERVKRILESGDADEGDGFEEIWKEYIEEIKVDYPDVIKFIEREGGEGRGADRGPK